MRLAWLALAWPCAAHVLHQNHQDDVGSEGCGCSFAAEYPRQYVAHRTLTPPEIDGSIDEPLWQEVPWTDDFVDIADGPVPWKRTRVKMRWDQTNVYFAAHLEEDEIWANITKDDEVIFHDNDFEIFVDPAGSNQFYKEFEINARGKIWDLCLNRSYLNGGYENSSRVFGKTGYDIEGTSAAVRVDGTLNDATAKSSGWTVEVGLPIASLMVNSTGSQEPAPGVYWRLDFSRVEWRVLRQGSLFVKDPAHKAEDNWVWQPIGAIQMHMPERWGILQFADEHVGKTPLKRDPHWPVRHAAAAMYDAQQARAKSSKTSLFAGSLEGLQPFLPAMVLDESCTQRPTVECTNGTAAKCKAFEVKVLSADGSCSATMDEKRQLLTGGEGCGCQ